MEHDKAAVKKVCILRVKFYPMVISLLRSIHITRCQQCAAKTAKPGRIIRFLFSNLFEYGDGLIGETGMKICITKLANLNTSSGCTAAARRQTSSR